MRRTLVLAAAIPMILKLAPASATAQEESPTPPPRSKAERVSDRAIGNVMAWRIKAAENILNANRENLGETEEYNTALGYLRATQGQAEEGVALLQDAAKANSDDPAPQFYLGEVQYSQQKFDAANRAWNIARKRSKKLVDADAPDARAQYYLGASQARLKQFGPARAALEAARDGGFDPVLVDYQLGFSYVLTQNWRDAVTAFDAVEKNDPKFAPLYFYRGLAWGKLDRTDKMLIDMNRFIELAPDAPEVGIARTYLDAAKR